MPQAVSPTVAAISQSPTAGEFIELFEVDLTRLAGQTTILRFSPSAANPTAGSEGALSSAMEAPRWRGHVFVPVSVKCEGFGFASEGPPPEPKLTVPALSAVFAPYLILYDNMVGADVRRWRTYTRFLDNGATPSWNEHYPVEVFTIDRIGQRTNTFIEFVLASPMDQEGRMLPGRQIIQRTCRFVYRRWNAATQDHDYTGVTCPYTQAATFNELGQPVSDRSKDKCSHDLTLGCKVRPHPGGELPFSGFPGAARFRL